MLPVNLPKLVYLVKQVFGTECVQESEWATSEWRETKSKHSSDVTIGRTVENSILEAPHSLVDESRRNSKLDLFNIMAVCVQP